jgi:hypothetical protein
MGSSPKIRLKTNQKENNPMNSIPIDEIFLHIYALVDDWYQAQASEMRKGQLSQ